MKHWKSLLCSVLAALMLAPYAFAAPPVVSDIQGHWAQDSIQQAINDGWVNGYPDGTFRPEKTITRTEFVKMVLNAIHLTPQSSNARWLKENSVSVKDPLTLTPYSPAAFLDMDTNWLTTQGWLEVAVNFGLVVPSDYNNNMFRPAKAITRYEIAVMVDRAMGKVYPASQPLTEVLSFSDADQIPEWVRGYISEAVKAGVLTGYPDGTFGHSKSATRAEAVVMVQRMLDYTREGVDPDINLSIVYMPDYGSPSEQAQITTKKVRMQRIDDVLYASIYDIITVQKQLMGDTYCRMFWHPIWQQLFVSMDQLTLYRAGTDRFGYFSTYSKLESLGDTFSTPTRMLDGEIMIPIYVSATYPEYHHHWEGYWDAATNTLTIPVYNPSGYHLS